MYNALIQIQILWAEMLFEQISSHRRRFIPGTVFKFDQLFLWCREVNIYVGSKLPLVNDIVAWFY